MKNLNLFLFAAGTALLTACGGSAEKAAEPVVATYTLDASASTLEWTGKKTGAEEGQHTGTVTFTEGSVETTDNVVTSGTVVLAATTINATDLEGEYQGMLNGHLKNEDFFDVEKYPNITVKFGEVSDNKIKATVNVTGMDFTQEIPVTTKVSDDKVTADGKFTFDFEGIKSKGFAAGGETRILPQIDFNVHLEFKK